MNYHCINLELHRFLTRFIFGLLICHLTAVGPALAQNHMSTARKARVSNAKTFEELFSLTRFIELEMTDKSMIGMIRKALYIGQHWFVLDGTDNKVLQFNDHGEFVQIVGGVGSGPTEYLSALSIFPGFDQQLIVTDNMTGQMILYNANGQYQRRFSFRTDFDGRNPDVIIWSQPNRLYLGFATPMSAQSKPEHTLFAYEQDQFRRLAAWSTTDQRILAQRKPTTIGVAAVDGFALVDGQIWAGSPFEAYMVIYDQRGKQQKVIRRKHADQITVDSVLKLDRTQLKDIIFLRRQVRNGPIFPIGDLVLAPIRENGKRYMDIYDRQGELLNSTVTFAPIVMPLATQEDRMITYLPTLRDVAQHKEMLGTQGFELLTSAGFDPDNYEDQNNFLMIFTLVR